MYETVVVVVVAAAAAADRLIDFTPNFWRFPKNKHNLDVTHLETWLSLILIFSITTKL